MKKIYSLLFALLVIGGSALAEPKIFEENLIYGYGDAFIFVEGGVEFAIYPDGQFDFFYNSRRTGYNVNVVTPHVNISYNAGYNYDPYVQYDDFGAVIQVENVPVFYDYYGRIIQAGNVYISYNRFGRVATIGGLHLHYNSRLRVTRFSGYINAYNPRYVYRPWHSYYVRPHVNHTVVYHQPYRAHYHPNRFAYNYYVDYYRKHSSTHRRSYYRPGENATAYHRGSRTREVRDLRPQNFNSDYTVATRMESRNETRSNSGTSRDVRNTRKQPTYATENRGRTRVSVNEPPTVRDTRASRSQVEQRNNTRETSRDTGTYSRGRYSSANTPAARNKSSETTVTRTSRSSAPTATTNSNSRSSRGRGN
ncbi:hypothetical protein [Salinimicrobium sp. GXAS 041]|uniref:hypothetical protein n=1 Tax=Salinimicrobium sp. GXAS 041 TaxID=3400806 RepID=UPI003C793863